jgi:hypothetical protein
MKNDPKNGSHFWLSNTTILFREILDSKDQPNNLTATWKKY